jgi:hypothetical protein
MTRTFALTLLVAGLMLTSCQSGSDKKYKDAAKLSVLTFDQSAPAYTDKPVIMEGTVIHTCKHSGKRLFLVDGNDSIRVEVTAGEGITKFDEKLVGSRIRVFGTLKEERIDEKYLSDWENEVKKPKENHETGVHSGAQGHEDQTADDKLGQINSLREELKNSGKDHLSFYSVEAEKYEEIK